MPAGRECGVKREHFLETCATLSDQYGNTVLRLLLQEDERAVRLMPQYWAYRRPELRRPRPDGKLRTFHEEANQQSGLADLLRSDFVGAIHASSGWIPGIYHLR